MTLSFVSEYSFIPTNIYTIEDLESIFKQSSFYNPLINDYYPTAIKKAIWYALKRSTQWEMISRGTYRYHNIENPSTVEKSNVTDSNTLIFPFNRTEYILFLSQNIFEVIQLKLKVSDERLRKHLLSSKAIGEDLYYLTESYYRGKNIYKGKHSMSDFITPAAKELLVSKKKSNLVYEHMVPKNLYINEIINSALLGNLKFDDVHNALTRYYYVCTVTDLEDALLPSTKMDLEWDGINPFYRYQMAGIEFLPNSNKY